MSKMKLVLIIPLVVTLLALPLLGGCAKPEEKAIKIGVAIDTSGVAAGWGVPMTRAMQWLVDQENDQGGLLVGQDRYQLQLIIGDTKGTPEGAAAAAKKLVNVDKVNFVVGGIMGYTGLAIIAITEPAGVLFGTEADVADLIHPDHSYTFRNTPSVEQIATLAAWNQKHWPGVERVAIIYEHDEDGERMIPYLEKYHSTTLDLVAVEYAELDQEDYRPVLSRVIKENPDALDVGINPPAQMALLMKQARELGFQGPLWTVFPLSPSTIVEVAGKEAAEGVCGWTAPSEGPYAPEMSKEIRAWYIDKFGQWDDAALAGDCCLAAFLQAIEAAGTTDTAEVIKVLESGMAFDTYFGKAPFDLESFYGIPHQSVKPLAILEIHNGEARFIDNIPAQEQLELFDSLGWEAEWLK